MNMTDPIADMLTRIRNAVRARHTQVKIPASKMKLAIARVLKEEGYINDIEILKDNPQGTIRITLRYVDKKPVLTQLKRVSKPGLRVYSKRANIPRVRGGQGISILSTPRGLMTGRRAYQEGLGGEIVCYVW
ncbi:MAG TPA: 30S ribosomal protein S8 [Ktedonobacteraceae bacterium]|jgi:small subunit ribosomal protein S8|nr:30S ribosomal protein S8 [Ktedonobacteraceae bacterium]